MNLISTLQNALHEAERLKESNEKKLGLLFLTHYRMVGKDVELPLTKIHRARKATVRHLAFLAYHAGGYNANCPNEKYNGNMGHLVWYIGEDKTVKEAIQQLIIEIFEQ